MLSIQRIAFCMVQIQLVAQMPRCLSNMATIHSLHGYAAGIHPELRHCVDPSSSLRNCDIDTITKSTNHRIDTKYR